MTKQDTKRVIIAAGLEEGAAPTFVTLPDPRTGQPSTYLLAGGRLQEVNWYKQQFSSWFVGDSVLQDGGLYLCTPVDPLLVALPLLGKARGQVEGEREGRFCDMEQILQDVEHSAAQQLTSLLAPQLACVCDVKSVGGQDYFRLNDAKVLAWLHHKVGQAQAALLGSSSAASYAAMEGPALTAYAAGLMGEYLSAAWQARLTAALGLPEEAPEGPGARPAHPSPLPDPAEGRAEKRVKLDPKEAAKLKAAEARVAAKQQKLAKEAQGMRKLSSFFAPRPGAK